MQGGLTNTDRRLVLGAGIAALAIIAITATVGGGLPREESPVPASYSADSGGALAAYLLLRELDYPVRRWEQPPASLPASADVLIIAEPTELPGEGEAGALVAFLERGGRVVFCGPGVDAFLKGPPLIPAPVADWQRFPSEFPSAFTRSADPIVLRPRALWRELQPSQMRLYGNQDGAAVVSWRVGEGEVLWWASATPLTNAGLTRDGNLQLFLNAVSSRAGEPLEVYWDEYYHGRHGSLWSYIAQTPVKWGLLQTAFLAVAVLFAFSRRSGPVAPPPVVSRLSPLEFVDTMGSLYQRAGAASVAVDTSYRHLRLELARQLRLSSNTPNAALARAAEDRMGFPRELSHTLQAAEQARLRAQFPAKRALELVCELEDYLHRLKAPRATLNAPRALSERKR